jgi:heme exporter protein A
MGATMHWIQADQLSFYRGERVVLANLSFTLAAGELLFLRGANGAGKTTLLRILAGLWQADEGALVRATELDNQLRLLPAQAGLRGDLSALENVRLLAALQQQRAHAARILAALERWSINAELAHAPVRLLSSGQRKRVSLAAFTLIPSRLWLLDEPDNHLDAAGIQQLQQALLSHRANGGSAVLAVHGAFELAGARVLELFPAARKR